MENDVIIGIPIHNDLESFRETIYSILKSTDSFKEIILLESNSTDGCKEFCDYLSVSHPKIKVIHTEKEGPCKAYNRLFEIAKNKKCDLLLTQTDVIFTSLYKRDWLEFMKLVAKMDDVGAVTCIGGGGVSGPDYINGFKWIGGWCSYFPYRTIEKIGGYDENFPGGYGVDIDHTYRIMKSGLNIIEINYWVDHHQKNSREHDNNTNSEETKKEAAKYFKNKWGLK